MEKSNTPEHLLLHIWASDDCDRGIQRALHGLVADAPFSRWMPILQPAPPTMMFLSYWLFERDILAGFTKTLANVLM
jgi:hypothetical protein